MIWFLRSSGVDDVIETQTLVNDQSSTCYLMCIKWDYISNLHYVETSVVILHSDIILLQLADELIYRAPFVHGHSKLQCCQTLVHNSCSDLILETLLSMSLPIVPYYNSTNAL